jgi:hypothetical protein
MKAKAYAAILASKGISVYHVKERNSQTDACVSITEDININIQGRGFNVTQWIESEQTFVHYDFTDRMEAASLAATLPGVVADWVVSEDVGGTEWRMTQLPASSFAEAVNHARRLRASNRRGIAVHLPETSKWPFFYRSAADAVESFAPRVEPVAQPSGLGELRTRRAFSAKRLPNGNYVYRDVEIVRDVTVPTGDFGHWRATTRGALWRFYTVAEGKRHVDGVLEGTLRRAYQ